MGEKGSQGTYIYSEWQELLFHRNAVFAYILGLQDARNIFETLDAFVRAGAGRRRMHAVF